MHKRLGLRRPHEWQCLFTELEAAKPSVLVLGVRVNDGAMLCICSGNSNRDVLVTAKQSLHSISAFSASHLTPPAQAGGTQGAERGHSQTADPC